MNITAHVDLPYTLVYNESMDTVPIDILKGTTLTFDEEIRVNPPMVTVPKTTYNVTISGETYTLTIPDSEVDDGIKYTRIQTGGRRRRRRSRRSKSRKIKKHKKSRKSRRQKK